MEIKLQRFQAITSWRMEILENIECFPYSSFNHCFAFLPASLPNIVQILDHSFRLPSSFPLPDNNIQVVAAGSNLCASLGIKVHQDGSHFNLKSTWLKLRQFTQPSWPLNLAASLKRFTRSEEPHLKELCLEFKRSKCCQRSRTYEP